MRWRKKHGSSPLCESTRVDCLKNGRPLVTIETRLEPQYVMPWTGEAG